MFDTPEFRQMLMETFGSECSRKLMQFDETIVDNLQKIAVKVSSKTSGDIEACAEPKEVRSARTIAEQATALAQRNGRQYITWAEVEYVIETNFCSVFPFCTPEEL